MTSDSGMTGLEWSPECRRSSDGDAGFNSRKSNTHDAGHAGNDLSYNGRAHGLTVGSGVNPKAKTVDDCLAASDVAARSTKRLGERAHEDVDVTGVDSEVVRDAPAARAHSTDRVRFVDEQVELWATLDTYGKRLSMSGASVPCTSS